MSSTDDDGRLWWAARARRRRAAQLSPDERFGRRFNAWALFGAGVWTVFLIPVAGDALRYDALRATAGIVGLLVFVATYLSLFLLRRHHASAARRLKRPTAGAVGFYVLLLALATGVLLLVPPSATACYVYVAVAGIFLFPMWVGAGQAVVLAAGTELLVRTVPGWDSADGIGLSVFLASFAVWGIAQAMGRSMDLVAAKDENAQLLVGQERARMARDLHDILGHSLTVITVKAELAGRLLEAGGPDGVARARRELADVERLSRDALADTRRTVEGYRDLSLPGEISRARAALEAAEIEAHLPGTTDEVPTERRELFAWTVREGVTNVVRHSAARSCTVTVTPDRVSIADDGRGCAGAAADGGNGLRGLRERAAAAGARVVVHSPTQGGFVLSVQALGAGDAVEQAAPAGRPARSTSPATSPATSPTTSPTTPPPSPRAAT